MGLVFGDQEEALEQQEWHLGAGGAPGTGSTALGLVWPILQGQHCPLELPAEKAFLGMGTRGPPQRASYGR